MEEVLINTDIYLMFQKLYSKMKIPLSLAILKEIVEDGIKEIKSRLNFTKRQRVMKQDVLDKIHIYCLENMFQLWSVILESPLRFSSMEEEWMLKRLKS